MSASSQFNRIAEIAELLALGLSRIQARKASQLPTTRETSCFQSFRRFSVRGTRRYARRFELPAGLDDGFKDRLG